MPRQERDHVSPFLIHDKDSGIRILSLQKRRNSAHRDSACAYVDEDISLLKMLLSPFLKTTFAEGQERYREIFSPTPPILVLQCVERVLCAKNADFDGMQAGGGSAVSYAWWIWQKGYAGPTTLDWINHPKPSLNPNVTQLQLF
jgi:hypothetical protein